MRILRLVSLVILLVLFGLGARAQQQGTGLPPFNSRNTPFGDRGRDDPAQIPPSMRAQVERGRQSERQKKIIAETDRLLALAAELKRDLDKTKADPSVLQELKKAEEIERLAHSVRERMKG